MFREVLKSRRLRIPQSIAPLLCLSSEDLERISSVLGEVPFSKVVEGYFRGSKAKGARFPPLRLADNLALKKLPRKPRVDLFKNLASEIGRLVESHMKSGTEAVLP